MCKTLTLATSKTSTSYQPDKWTYMYLADLRHLCPNAKNLKICLTVWHTLTWPDKTHTWMKYTSTQSYNKKLYFPKLKSSGIMSISSLALASFCRRKSRLAIHSFSSSWPWAKSQLTPSEQPSSDLWAKTWTVSGFHYNKNMFLIQHEQVYVTASNIRHQDRRNRMTSIQWYKFSKWLQCILFIFTLRSSSALVLSLIQSAN